MKPIPTKTLHKIDGPDPFGSRFVAHCSCGWSVAEDTEAEIGDAIEKHLEEAERES